MVKISSIDIYPTTVERRKIWKEYFKETEAIDKKYFEKLGFKMIEGVRSYEGDLNFECERISVAFKDDFTEFLDYLFLSELYSDDKGNDDKGKYISTYSSVVKITLLNYLIEHIREFYHNRRIGLQIHELLHKER